MQLEVSFFDETHPELASTRVGTQEVSPLSHRQKVIYFNCSPSAINEELDDVLACRVVDWIQILVLWKDLV